MQCWNEGGALVHVLLMHSVCFIVQAGVVDELNPLASKFMTEEANREQILAEAAEAALAANDAQCVLGEGEGRG